MKYKSLYIIALVLFFYLGLSFERDQTKYVAAIAPNGEVKNTYIKLDREPIEGYLVWIPDRWYRKGYLMYYTGVKWVSMDKKDR